MARPRSKNKPWFDNEEADRVCLVFEKVLKHTEGKWAGTPFVLTSWQADDILRPLFGWKRWDPQWEMWVRQYSNALILLPRGNGKTELASGTVLVLLCADGEYGAEVYSGAEDRDQAAIVFRPAAEMVNLSRRLSNRLEVVESKKRIIDPRTNSFYQVLPRDRLGTGSQGFKVHGFVMDEYHTQKNKAFLNAMRKGMGKRIQPLGVVISTETDDPTGASAEEFDYALKVNAGEIEDPSYFTYIRRAPAEAINDPFNEKYWYEANPALNDYLSLHTLKDEARQAQQKPSEVNDFLRFRLNIRTTQSVRWMPLDRWDQTAGLSKEKPLQGNDELAGRSCYAGLHLGAVTDVVALVLDFPDTEGGHDMLYRFWAPAARLPDLNLRTNNQASVWVKEGALRLVEGDTIDYKEISKQVDLDAQEYDVLELGFHRWGMTQLATELDEAGMVVTAKSSGIALSAAVREWEKLIYEKRYRHGGHPVMRWMVTNISVKKDSDGNIKIDVKESKDTVVGAIASVFALDLALRNADDMAESAIY